MDLCKKLGLSDYLQLCKDKYPHCTEALLKKYAENPKRKVYNLVDALYYLGRQEVMRWLQVKLGIYQSSS